MAGQQVMEQQNPTAKTVIDRLREAAHCALNTAQHPHCGWIVTASFQRAVSRERLRQLAGADPEDSERMYWALPGASAAYLALGRALVITGAGSGRVEGLRRQMDAYAIHSADAADVRQAAADVRWFGGMSFAPKRPSQMWEGWPEAKFVLPHIVVEWQGQDTARVVATVAIHTADELETQLEGVRRELRWLERGAAASGIHGRKEPVPPCRPMAEAAWCAQVSSSAAEIRSGQYEKVVLARYEAVHGIHRPLADVLAELEGKYPDSQVFAVWHSGQCFLGASPERLVSVSGETVDVDCLAGTEARGRTADEDEHLAAQLLESAKNRLEHEVVRAWIVEQLQTADVLDLTWPPTPQVKRLANVQHLHTPIRGRRREQQSVLDLVDELHPTPAVAGRPREKALAVIAERESLERGWYAGPVGWMNGRGEGQFAVALRSALVRGDTAYVFAGAGIMGDSNPALEWEETWMKMRAVRTALLPLEGRYSP